MVIAIAFMKIDYWCDRLEIMTHGSSDRHFKKIKQRSHYFRTGA
ncbi:MAG: hypothetical protein ACKO1I_07885 [Microcystis aeruginosa]